MANRDYKNLTIDDLNTLYRKGDSVDSELFSEMRSNILLCAGDHYRRKSLPQYVNTRENSTKNTDQKIRLTKNHVQRIMKHYVNTIVAGAPTTRVKPEIEIDLQCQKTAELNQSVWHYGKQRYNLRRKTWQWAEDFFKIGECGVKITWNPMKGDFKGYEAGEDQDEYGRPMPDQNKPVFSGDFEWDRLWGFNMFRSEEAQNWDDSPFIGIRKLVDRDILKAEFSNVEKIDQMISGSSDMPFVVFDASTSSYKKTDTTILVREFYFRPSPHCPKGFYYISVSGGILEQGELPFGIFPIEMEPCEEAQTSPRGISPIKHARPYQVEHNRSSSKQAEHQITLGDDKLILMNNSKITQGQQLPGVRTMAVTGQAPTILAGRAGEQYSAYIASNLSEFYEAMMVQDLLSDRTDVQMDPMGMLYKSLRQRKNFAYFLDKFGNFQIRVTKLYLALAKQYLDDEAVIPIIGKQEIVNISEFRTSVDNGYKIEIEESSEDVESMMGRQLTLTQLIQYAGQQLNREDIGKIIKNMPFANHEEIFGDLMLNYDSATNIILALDRGQFPPIKPQLDKEYVLKRLTSRQIKSDYEYLPQNVRDDYDLYMQALNEKLAEEIQTLKAAEADMIPAMGYSVKCDFYVPDPNNPSKTKRAELPIDTLAWVIERLQRQGMTLDRIGEMQQSAQAGLAGQVMSVDNGASAQAQAGQDLNGSGPIQGA